MLIKTRGIVLKTIKYGETSVIVDMYTEERGLRKYIMNGVRSRRSRVRASLVQVMSLVDLVAYDREDRELNHVKEIRPAYVYQSLPFNVRKGAIALFMAEVARKTIHDSEENAPLFAFLFDIFRYLDETTQPIGNIHLHFLLGLTAYLGFLPGGECCAETPVFDMQEGTFVASVSGHTHYLNEELSRTLSALLQRQLRDCHEVKMDAAHRRLLLQHLLDYYRLHIDYLSEINAHRILQEVLS